jgi:hypothetical protein
MLELLSKDKRSDDLPHWTVPSPPDDLRFYWTIRPSVISFTPKESYIIYRI